MYWQLTTDGDDPRRLALPGGLDPADPLHRAGAAALRTAVESASHFADLLLDARLTATAHDGNPATAEEAVRAAAALVAASPPARWLDRIDRVAAALHVPPGTVHGAVLDARPITGPSSSSYSSMQRRQASLSAPTQQRNDTIGASDVRAADHGDLDSHHPAGRHPQITRAEPTVKKPQRRAKT